MDEQLIFFSFFNTLLNLYTPFRVKENVFSFPILKIRKVFSFFLNVLKFCFYTFFRIIKKSFRSSKKAWEGKLRTKIFVIYDLHRSEIVITPRKEFELAIIVRFFANSRNAKLRYVDRLNNPWRLVTPIFTQDFYSLE